MFSFKLSVILHWEYKCQYRNLPLPLYQQLYDEETLEADKETCVSLPPLTSDVYKLYIKV